MAPGTVTLPLRSPFADECQSFLDNVIAGLGRIGSWNKPRIASQPGRSVSATIYEFAMDNLSTRHSHLGRLGKAPRLVSP
jgi:hypothetical protein